MWHHTAGGGGSLCKEKTEANLQRPATANWCKQRDHGKVRIRSKKKEMFKEFSMKSLYF